MPTYCCEEFEKQYHDSVQKDEDGYFIRGADAIVGFRKDGCEIYEHRNIHIHYCPFCGHKLEVNN